MKDNKAKNLLLNAIQSLPSSNSFEEARIHIRKAISKIEEVEMQKSKKDSKQLSLSNKWEYNIKTGLTNPFSPKTTVSVLDKMINAEQQKLESLQKSKIESQNDKNVGPILG